MTSWRLGDLAKELGVSLKGDADIKVDHVATLKQAGPGSVSFLSNPRYAPQLLETHASAVILHPDKVADAPTAALISEAPYVTYAALTRLFDNRPKPSSGVHATAVVADDVSLGDQVTIGPGVVLEPGCVIGNRVEIGPGCVLGANCRIGDDSRLAANVTLYHGVTLGQRCLLHSGTVLGSDGFGFAPHQGRWHKVMQLGGVTLGDDVDIGASTAIDRGALDDTRIGHGVIIDNHCHIAHNVDIGDQTAIAGCCGISGSTRIGSHCVIGGNVIFAGHIEVCDNVFISGGSTVTNSIREPGSYASGTALTTTTEWRKNVARFRQLDKLARKLLRLEKHVMGKQRL